jgi:4-hydroxybenzoate polyprenyltransferase
MKLKFIILFIYLTSCNAFSNNIVKLKMNSNNILTNMSPVHNNKLKHYYKLSRPNSLIYEFALPITGSYLSTKKLTILYNPNVILVGLLSVIIACNCMIINDYYDYILGTDKLKKDKILNKKLLAPDEVLHTSTYITLLSYYLITLVTNNMARFVLSNSVILGYLYTPIFKNIPFVKNFVVSFIISQSIIVGCLVANGDFKLIIPCLTYLFNLIMWQEIMLDINDREGDKNNNIMTIPVKYGYEKANKIALCFLVLGTILPYGFSLQFILLQMPLILMNIRTIQKNKILNKIALKIANFIMLLSGLYMCYI